MRLAPRSLGRLCSFVLTLACAPLAAAEGEVTPLAWERGPATAPIGDNLAEVEVGEDYVFLGAEDTQKLLEMNQNPVSGTELAIVSPAAEDQGWFLVFEFDEIGYVPDDEKDELDAEALLASVREGTEAANEERKRRGWPAMTIVGWHEKPHYDEATHHLTWSIIGESQGRRSVNRAVKLLGRRGVMTATLVASPDELEAAIPAADDLLSAYSFRKGNTYAEYVPGTDRLAEIGLTALVVGGAGAALIKSGLLARFWKLFVVGAVALAGGARKLWASFSGTRTISAEDPVTRA
jgi:uncharacterized membrane-anchored protein